MAQAAAITRQKELVRQAASDARRLALADQLYKEGEVSVASRMYVWLARRKTPVAPQARQRLSQLIKDAQTKLNEIDGQLAKSQSGLSASELMGPGDPPDEWKDSVAEAFEGYDRLAGQYRGYRPAHSEIKTHVVKQRRRSQFARILNEPEAKALWESGQEHEAEDNQCCAYWVYEQASRLTPAPSAQLALGRFEQMKQDPKIVAAAEACREVQECHKLYNRAQLFSDTKPARAKELFEEILARAPDDSEVYLAAQRHVEQMR